MTPAEQQARFGEVVHTHTHRCDVKGCTNQSSIKLEGGGHRCLNHYPPIMNREELEAEALRVVSATNYYDLADNIESTSDEELRQIIAANGSEKLEEAIAS